LKRHAVFVDAGYLFAQGSVSLTGRKVDRSSLKLDQNEAISQLNELALGQSVGVHLLRVYWYDGARNGPTSEHRSLAEMNNVKLRLGSINSFGQQKEVDSLLVTDLIDLARNQSICDATVVAGDTDVRIAVQIAQSFGVRVHLVGLEPSRVSQSPALRQEVDTVHEISRADVAKFLTILDQAQLVKLPDVMPVELESEAKPAIALGTEGEFERVVGEATERVLLRMDPEQIRVMVDTVRQSHPIPTEQDRHLLGTCRALLGRNLTPDERQRMRVIFVDAMRRRNLDQ
jgi:uncharacterized LabA/DUF88 family protein